MASGKIIDIHGRWTSKDGKNKIQLMQSFDKFEGYVGSPDDVRISLGNISDRKLCFKQTWHKGKNKGAIATVHGYLTSDSSTILLEFEGTRSNGKGMKGKNAIVRESFIGMWTPMDLSESGDIWSFNLKGRWEITGYYESNLKEKLDLKGERNHRDANFFTISVQSSNGRWEEEIKGEYRCPSIILTLPPSLGDRTLLLERRKQFESLPSLKYHPLPLIQEKTEPAFLSTKDTSTSSEKRPSRDQSNVDEKTSEHFDSQFPSKQYVGQPDDDLRTALLSTVSLPLQKRTSNKSSCCCCCIS